jgi:hypothetical protein
MSDDTTEPSLDGRPLTQRELLISINGKLEVVVAELHTQGTMLSDHETRLRLVEQNAAHFVSWRQFWTGIATAATLAGGLSTVLTHINFH